MDFGGNDWSSQNEICNREMVGNTRAVEGWQDTWQQLQEVVSSTHAYNVDRT